MFNFGNLISSKSGVGQSINTSSPIAATNSVDANGAPLFRMNTFNNSINYTTFRRSTSINDVWQAQIGVRYIF
ncbi:MAG: hypothetical protein H7101_00815 [Deinococcales bacterium]|nr:hypothetical protein [Chitinophagaceae bacterium]